MSAIQSHLGVLLLSSAGLVSFSPFSFSYILCPGTIRPSFTLSSPHLTILISPLLSQCSLVGDEVPEYSNQSDQRDFCAGISCCLARLQSVG